MSTSRAENEIARLKEQVCRRIDTLAPDLIATSRQIWENPELAFQERQAAASLAAVLDREGFTVERGVGGLETAFTATLRGGEGPAVGLFSEYDALPELGHGCGHNLLAISGVGAAVGLAPFISQLPGTIRVQGTPAEEGPSGKTLLLREGVFDGLHFALIFHPADEANVLAAMRTGQGMTFTFTGRHAHAAANPELAIDALNGVIATFNNVNLLRQHFRPDVSVTGNIPNGGSRVFEGQTDFVELRKMVLDCARGAALATRTTLAVEFGILERGMKLNEVVTTHAVDNAADLGIDLAKRITMGGMSDFGNVSHLVPATHFSTATWPSGVTAHTPEAVAASNQPQAYEAALAAAKIEAMTALDLLLKPTVAAAARDEFARNDLGVIPLVAE